MRKCAGLVWLMLLVGCNAAPPTDPDAAVTAPSREPTWQVSYFGGQGEAVQWRSLVDAGRQADVMVIGEMHGHAMGLSQAADLWEAILQQGDGETNRPALSLEFFDRDQQVHLDDYLTGVTDDAAFRKNAGRTDRNYPPGHRRMVEAAREAKLAVIASNAPSRYTTRARTEGFESLHDLTVTQQRRFDLPDVDPSDAYRQRFFKLFREMLATHGGEAETEAEIDNRIEGYFRAQQVWDATMAASIARASTDGRRPVVHVVGQFHSDYDGGLIQAMRARLPGLDVVTVSMIEAEAWTSDLEGRADFIVLMRPDSQD